MLLEACRAGPKKKRLKPARGRTGSQSDSESDRSHRCTASWQVVRSAALAGTPHQEGATLRLNLAATLTVTLTDSGKRSKTLQNNSWTDMCLDHVLDSPYESRTMPGASLHSRIRRDNPSGYDTELTSTCRCPRGEPWPADPGRAVIYSLNAWFPLTATVNVTTSFRGRKEPIKCSGRRMMIFITCAQLADVEPHTHLKPNYYNNLASKPRSKATLHQQYPCLMRERDTGDIPGDCGTPLRLFFTTIRYKTEFISVNCPTAEGLFTSEAGNRAAAGIREAPRFVGNPGHHSPAIQNQGRRRRANTPPRDQGRPRAVI
ncbi:hypothetical protein Bbelb_007680 [Branchiostoma belcheri]|nr:hypothetical protein Bbelb_007680 [Branchiostoma belcheri]